MERYIDNGTHVHKEARILSRPCKNRLNKYCKMFPGSKHRNSSKGSSWSASSPCRWLVCWSFSSWSNTAKCHIREPSRKWWFPLPTSQWWRFSSELEAMSVNECASYFLLIRLFECWRWFHEENGRESDQHFSRREWSRFAPSFRMRIRGSYRSCYGCVRNRVSINSHLLLCGHVRWKYHCRGAIQLSLLIRHSNESNGVNQLFQRHVRM